MSRVLVAILMIVVTVAEPVGYVSFLLGLPPGPYAPVGDLFLVVIATGQLVVLGVVTVFVTGYLRRGRFAGHLTVFALLLAGAHGLCTLLSVSPGREEALVLTAFPGGWAAVTGFHAAATVMALVAAVLVRGGGSASGDGTRSSLVGWRQGRGRSRRVRR